MRHPLILIGLSVFLLSCLAAPAVPRMVVVPPGASATKVPLQRLLDSLHIPAERIWLSVMKGGRTFRVMADSTEIKRYPCVLGEQPVGDKRQQGDRRTPEGTYTFRSKRMHDKWHAFVWIDYPNAESWRRFKERKRTGEIAADADIGGEVGIHGVPEGKDHWIDQGADWSWGCIALRNDDLDEIYPYIVPQRTRLVIVP